MTAKQTDTVAMTEQQLDAVAGGIASTVTINMVRGGKDRPAGMKNRGGNAYVKCEST